MRTISVHVNQYFRIFVLVNTIMSLHMYFIEGQHGNITAMTTAEFKTAIARRMNSLSQATAGEVYVGLRLRAAAGSKEARRAMVEAGNAYEARFGWDALEVLMDQADAA